MGDEYFLYDHVPVIFWWLRWGNHTGDNRPGDNHPGDGK